MSESRAPWTGMPLMYCRRMRSLAMVRITGAAIVLVLASSGPIASATASGGLVAAQAGGACTAEGAVIRRGGTTLTCSKAGSGLAWVATKGGTSTPRAGSGAQPRSQSDIPAIIQNWGFNLSAYSAESGRAGAMQIRGTVPPTFSGPNAAADNFMYRNLIGVIGEVIDSGGKRIEEPQFGFIVPLGTPVVSMIDGTVCDVPKLWSGDFSVRVAPPGMKCSHGAAYVLYEHEHVLSPSVKVGQKVVAGQQIAIVSDYNPHWKAKGLGTIETGIFFIRKGVNRPLHACLPLFLDPRRKAAMLADLSSVFAAWEAERGDPSLYDEARMPVAGCYTTAEIAEG